MDLADPVRPRWARPGLAVLLAVTAVAYIWGLDRSGYANSFYAAAVEAGSKSWKAMFYGSIDSSNFITVDKPPAALWVMDLSARIFGFNTWSLLVPNALEGVAAVGLLYATVRRWAGAGAGLIAGAVLAATPVAALMFRFDNPDAFLVMALVAAIYCITRALERAGTRWVVAAGAVIGVAFLAKMMQAFTIVPAVGLVYLVAAPTTLRRRVAQLAAGLVALVVSAGWWVAIVALVPAADRPFVDGSPDNSILNLIFVYNGFGRLTGSGSGGGANFSGTAGVLRLFNDVMGGQASWLIPAALVAAGAGIAARGRRPRTDRVRAALLLWAGWLVVTGAVFSYGEGIIHTYYTVALAPAIAALVAIGARQLWAGRHLLAARLVGAVTVAGTGTWAWLLLDRTPSWHPWLRVVVLAATALGAAGLVALPALRRLGAAATVGVAGLVAVACLAGPLAYAGSAVTTPHTGSIPSAGPAVAGSGGFGGGFPGGGTRTPGRSGGLPGGTAPGGGFPGSASAGSASAGSASAGSAPSGGFPGASGGAAAPTGNASGGRTGTAPSGTPGAGAADARSGGGGGAGGGATVTAAERAALARDASAYRWVLATDGSQNAAGIELATGGLPVMAIGGFSGQGGNLSLAAFEAYVARGEIHYYLAGSGGGPGGGSSSGAITSWVEAHFKAVTIGGTTVYDLTARTSS